MVGAASTSSPVESGSGFGRATRPQYWIVREDGDDGRGGGVPARRVRVAAAGGREREFVLIEAVAAVRLALLWQVLRVDADVARPEDDSGGFTAMPVAVARGGDAGRAGLSLFQGGSGLLPHPMEWTASKAIASRFISEVTVVAGDVDTAAPPGFTKLPGDLNDSASGDYVYLCVKRGGPRALTELYVLFEPTGGDNSPSNGQKSLCCPEKVVAVDCNSGGAAGDGTGTKVCLGYDSVQLKGNVEQINTLAITDIAVVVGEGLPPSRGYMKVSRNLNEGAPGAQPVFLYYQLSPLGGFVCDSGSKHSEFGECLFAPRHLSTVKNLLDLDEGRLGVAQAALGGDRGRRDGAIMEVHYRHHQPSMLQRLRSGLERAQSYESKAMQEEALKRIPVENLHERARANPSPMPLYQDELVKQLLHWFKREFFTWMNQPRCSACNHDKTRSVRTEGPSTAEEVAGQASRVEVYQCPACGAFTRFPRYNSPVKLLDTRTGRCGEWANCFTLCCRAMGFEARYVLDVTDHVWTEVYSDYYKRWLHCDSCEDQLDCPLTYEVGWGKKLSYIFSFAHDEVADTARRYTQNWPDMCTRRQDVSEAWLQATISQMNRSLRQQQSPERVAVLTARSRNEREELLRGRSIQKTEVKGRVSGSAEWKSQRNEDGTQGDVPAVDSSSVSSSEKTNSSMSVANVLQIICRNMVVGCQSAGCSSPFCLNGRTGLSLPEAPSDANERAAQAIQMATAWGSKGFSADSLSMLQCPPGSNDLRNFVWKNQPLVYLPLQDPPSADASVPLIDISGHNNHVESAQRFALRKPFRIPNSVYAMAGGPDQSEDRAFGLELSGDKRLLIQVNRNLPNDGLMLSLLARFDQHEALETKKTGTVSVLAGRFGALDSANCVEFRLRWDDTEGHFVCELQIGKGGAKSNSPLLSYGQYAHIALVHCGNTVAMYINGMEAAMADAPFHENESHVTLEGPTSCHSNSSAVISHVAVLPAKGRKDAEMFCAGITKSFVSAPPLRAFGPNGECSGVKCSEIAARAQSGFRVARVLMWGGNFFDGLQFVYEKTSAEGENTVLGKLVGNANAMRQASQPTATLELLTDEIIVRLSGRKGAWTDSITLHTNFGRTVTCGGKGGGDFSVPTPAESEIRSITFKVGDYLTDVTAFVLESPPAKSLEASTMTELKDILSSSESSSRQKAVSAGMLCSLHANNRLRLLTSNALRVFPALRYLDNIARQPEELKFHRIRASNKFFASNVGALTDAVAKLFMNWCGFEETPEQGELLYVFHPQGSQRVAAEAYKRLHFLKNVGTQ
ncbi:unnamed protein product [Phytophthora lilii]|uniref:Unnamed protein product n=1 Tax=Phytophthora lilii TaxID=2077276 RepID=A0A9W6U1D9_9STRA|nr:unnamed protein product [Phytophthora lilii]